MATSCIPSFPGTCKQKVAQQEGAPSQPWQASLWRDPSWKTKMADRVTTLHKFSEFRPQVHMQTLCLKQLIPHSRNPYRAVPKRKLIKAVPKKKGWTLFFTTNSDLAILCFKHLSRTPTEQWVNIYLAFKPWPMLSQTPCLLQKSTFGWLLLPDSTFALVSDLSQELKKPVFSDHVVL